MSLYILGNLWRQRYCLIRIINCALCWLLSCADYLRDQSLLIFERSKFFFFTIGLLPIFKHFIFYIFKNILSSHWLNRYLNTVIHQLMILFNTIGFKLPNIWHVAVSKSNPKWYIFVPKTFFEISEGLQEITKNLFFYLVRREMLKII